MAAQGSGVRSRLLDGRYEPRAKLGEGGMGVVYRAYDNKLDTEVVIKMPHRAMLRDPGFAERFQREIRALVKLTHPHVVKIFDVGTHEGVPFAVLQFLSGGSLADRRPRRLSGPPAPMPATTLGSWLLPIAQALDFIHQQGFIHRDIKPGNILFDSHGIAYLSDFGVHKAVAVEMEATRAANLTQTGMVVGTVHYMPPEAILAEKCDGRADQYALAVTVHELLAARYPIDGPTPSAILVKHTSKTPESLAAALPGCPQAVCEVLLAALAKDPADRYATCQEFAVAMLAATAQAPADMWVALATAACPRESRGERGRVACPMCEHLLHLKDNYAGKQARCPHCRGRLTVTDDLCGLIENRSPGNGEATTSLHVPAVPEMRETITRNGDRTHEEATQGDLFTSSEPPIVPLRREAAAQRPKSSWMLWSALGGVAVVLLLIVGAWMLSNADPQTADRTAQSPDRGRESTQAAKPKSPVDKGTPRPADVQSPGGRRASPSRRPRRTQPAPAVGDEVNPFDVEPPAGRHGGQEPTDPIVQAQGALVKIEGRVHGRSWSGLGFVVDSEGVVATNHHLVWGADQVQVRLAGGESVEAVGVLGYDLAADLVLIKVAHTRREAIDVSNPAPAVGGDFVRIRDVRGGDALARGQLEAPIPLAQLGARPRRRAERNQNAAGIAWIPMQPGCPSEESGGPVLDSVGRLLGIATYVAETPSQQGCIAAAELARLWSESQGSSPQSFERHFEQVNKARHPHELTVPGGTKVIFDEAFLNPPAFDGWFPNLPEASQETSQTVVYDTFENGDARGIYVQRGGRLDGRMASFYAESAVQMVGEYSDSKRAGQLRFWDNQGRLVFAGEFGPRNELHGLCCVFAEGRPVLVGQFKYDKLVAGTLVQYPDDWTYELAEVTGTEAETQPGLDAALAVMAATVDQLEAVEGQIKQQLRGEFVAWRDALRSGKAAELSVEGRQRMLERINERARRQQEHIDQEFRRGASGRR